MSKKRKDNLESFFRKGLGAHDFEFREDDWVQLEARLDEADRSRALFWRNFFAASTGVLIGLILLLWNVSGDGDLDEESIPSITNESTVERSDPDRTEFAKPPSGTEVKEAEGREVLRAVEGPAEDDEVNRGDLTLSSKAVPLNIDAAQPNNPAGNSSDPDSPVFYYSQEAANTSQDSPLGQIQISDILASATGISLHSKQAGSLIDPNLPSFNALDTIASDTMDESPLNPDQDSRLALALLIGPDLSSIGVSDFTSPGFNLGVNFEYYVLSKLTLNGGVIVGTKQYMAKGREYGKGRGLWTRGIVPDTTMGKCVVLDIPINIRYYPVGGARHKVFVSTGISSYIFLTEDYQFIYEMNAPDLIQGWSGKNEVQNYFGVINFSAGYELHLQRELYLQIEPLFKMPLDKLGFGNVEMMSAGVYFTIKYRFHRRREKLISSTTQ